MLLKIYRKFHIKYLLLFIFISYNIIYFNILDNFLIENFNLFKELFVNYMNNGDIPNGHIPELSTPEVPNNNIDEEEFQLLVIKLTSAVFISYFLIVYAYEPLLNYLVKHI
jgi:hypothetical protein